MNEELILEKMKNMHDDVREIKKDVKRQNGRVRKLEIRMSYIIGIGTAVTVVLGMLIKFL